MMKKATLLFVFVVGCLQLSAQIITFKRSIYFDTDKYIITNASKKSLDNLCDSLKSYQSFKIFLKGNTDSDADSIYNIRLSENRVNATRNYLLQKGLTTAVFSTEALGEGKPIASNETPDGKQKNRRVDITVSFTRVPAAIDSSQFLPSIKELYRLIERPKQEFCVDPSRDTVLRAEQGSIIYVKANSFKINNACKTKCVTIKIKEDFLKSDIFMDDLSTTSGGKILESVAMMYTEARDCQGNNLELIKGKDMVIMTPTDTIMPGTKIFQGNRTGHDSIMDWSMMNNSVLQNFSLSGLDFCEEMRCRQCKPCYFFFCRIFRADEVIAGWFNRCLRYDNKIYRKTSRLCRLAIRGVTSGKRVERINRNIEKAKKKFPECVGPTYVDSSDECADLYELFRQYGVNNMMDLTLALNKPLLDSFKVTSMAALRDTMNKIVAKQILDANRPLLDSFQVTTMAQLEDTLSKLNLQRIELDYLNKKISYDDLQYYIYNVSKLGWSNVDKFANFEKLINMKTNLKADPNIDCKLVFSKVRVLIPATREGKNMLFPNVPKDEMAWVVALKYLDGKAFMYMKEMKIAEGTVEIEFTEYSLEELKEKLKVLDR